jgi:23S rRNA pseudouridine2604 synthase
MSHSKKIKYFLVHNLKISYDHAEQLLSEGKVEVAGKVVTANILIDENSEIRCEDKILRPEKVLKYFLFYKPRGIECTRNPDIADNLLPFLPPEEYLFPVGRLDKQSEGLLLLTNDGKLTGHIIHTGVEKEYEVDVDKNIAEDFAEQMENGVRILNRITKPCNVKLTGENSFTIILTQGLNRQIRRMCYKCGCEVTRLKRIRIGKFELGHLSVGEIIETENVMKDNTPPN